MTTTDPKPGDRITWRRGTEMQVTRLGLPTFPGGPALVYARPIGGVNDTFIPAGEWETTPAAKCSAHGDPGCIMCSRNAGPTCDGCATFETDGMHWDTCANRDRTPMPDPPSPMTTTFTGPPGVTASVAYNLAADRRPDFDDNHMCLEYGTRGHDCGEHENPAAASEFTDEQVLAFQLAYDAGDAYEGVIQADRVRAGLAAIQWPARDVDGRVQTLNLPDDEGLPVDCLCSFTSGVNPKCPVHAPSPAARDVPLSEVRYGDRLSGVYVEEAPDRPYVYVELNSDCGYLVDFTITRPVNPLPDEPGTPGTATVRGVPGVAVFRTDQANGSMHWTSAVLVDGHRWHEDSDLADYQPLPNRQEGN